MHFGELLLLTDVESRIGYIVEELKNKVKSFKKILNFYTTTLPSLRKL